MSSRWCFAAAPHGLPLFIDGPPRSNFATAVLPAVYSRWCFAVPLLPSVSSRWCIATAPHDLPLFIGGPTRSNFAAAILPAVSSPWLSAAVPLASCFRRLPVPAAPPRHPRPATNLIRRRRSPVWLAIWRTWAGFANSQHRDAAFATPDNICARSSLLQH